MTLLFSVCTVNFIFRSTFGRRLVIAVALPDFRQILTVPSAYSKINHLKRTDIIIYVVNIDSMSMLVYAAQDR